MIRLATTEQAQRIDRESQTRYSLQARDLMSNAGAKSAKVFQKLYPDKNKKIVILCGPGNNGGDGIALYRELLMAKYLQVSCFFVAPTTSPTVEKQLRMLSKNIPLIDGKTKFPTADIYVDSLFGIGLNKNIENEFQVIIEAINSSRAQKKSHTLSLDMPSGLCSQTGRPLGIAVHADQTITFGIYKLGQWIQEGPQLCGKLFCVDIGFPSKLVQEIANTHSVFTYQDFKKYLPTRNDVSHKANYGHVKVWAGSPGLWGAALLTAQAAYRIGTGYVSVETTEPYFTQLPEVLVEKSSPIDDKYTYAVGPGWGNSPIQHTRIKKLRSQKISRVVLDAEALNILSQTKDTSLLPQSWILTPHSQEMCRLLGLQSAQEIEHDRSLAVLNAAQRYGCTVLLKGYRTLVASQGKVYVIPTGNAALAKAGSGDVLTGMISGLRAQGLSEAHAALVGAYLHGLLADIWITKNHINTLTPSDLLKGLPKVLKKLTTPKELPLKNPPALG